MSTDCWRIESYRGGAPDGDQWLPLRPALLFGFQLAEAHPIAKGYAADISNGLPLPLAVAMLVAQREYAAQRAHFNRVIMSVRLRNTDGRIIMVSG